GRSLRGRVPRRAVRQDGTRQDRSLRFDHAVDGGHPAADLRSFSRPGGAHGRAHRRRFSVHHHVRRPAVRRIRLHASHDDEASQARTKQSHARSGAEPVGAGLATGPARGRKGGMTSLRSESKGLDPDLMAGDVRKYLVLALKVAVGAATLWLVLRSLSYETVVRLLSGVAPAWLVVALFSFLFAQLFSALRFLFISRALG